MQFMPIIGIMSTNGVRLTKGLAAVLLLTSCASEPEKVPDPPPHAGPTISKQPESSQPPARKFPWTRAPKPAPIPTKAITVTTACQFRDETGYSGRLNLTVEDAQVQVLSALVTIPKRGVCSFDLAAFKQTRALPTIELGHTKTNCKIRVWQQAERVTVAFDQCQRMCTGSAWEYLWPILTDTRDGSCA